MCVCVCVCVCACVCVCDVLAYASVLRVSVLQVAKDFADVSMLHVNAASASAVVAWLVLSHVGIVQWL